MRYDWNTIVQQDWTLMLDRDGVINRRIVDGYVTQWSEFEFLPGVLDAIGILAQRFKYIFIVTNQQGIGKGLMSMAEVDEIHDKMCEAIEAHGGRIDGILVCPQLATDPDNYRKPNPQMAFMIEDCAPDIDMQRTLMVGDSNTDIEFGHNAGCHTVFIGQGHPDADDSFDSLSQFSQVFAL